MEHRADKGRRAGDVVIDMSEGSRQKVDVS